MPPWTMESGLTIALAKLEPAGHVKEIESGPRQPTPWAVEKMAQPLPWKLRAARQWGEKSRFGGGGG